MAVAKDVSGEDAFMRRAQLSQQRTAQSTDHPIAFPVSVQQKHRPVQENRVAFVPTAQSPLSQGKSFQPTILSFNRHDCFYHSFTNQSE